MRSSGFKTGAILGLFYQIRWAPSVDGVSPTLLESHTTKACITYELQHLQSAAQRIAPLLRILWATGTACWSLRAS